jgi:hypothetical protein
VGSSSVLAFVSSSPAAAFRPIAPDVCAEADPDADSGLEAVRGSVEGFLPVRCASTLAASGDAAADPPPLAAASPTVLC